MWHNGQFHSLTKHGRIRFIERIGIMSDKAMLEAFTTGKVMGFFSGYSFKSRPDWKQRHNVRLLTIYWSRDMACLDAVMAIQDRDSNHVFQYSEFQRRITNGRIRP